MKRKKGITEKKAKQRLEEMLGNFTAGSILGLLAEIYERDAEQARQDNDEIAFKQFKTAENALIVVGFGIDAVCPS